VSADSAAGLYAQVTIAKRTVDLTVSVESGKTLAILGPNGSGKSTLLQVIAGLLRPDSGRVVLDGHALVSPPHARGVALLAQEALLFPHLTVRDNVALSRNPSVCG
jgi:molybdate transport system ATP-binding protein